MREPFTDDDRGKRVENEAGEELGTIAAVEGETALVEARSGVMDSIRAALGWAADEGRRVTIRADAVTARTDDAVRLGIATGSTDGRSTDADERGRERAEDESDEPATTEPDERPQTPGGDLEQTAGRRDRAERAAPDDAEQAPSSTADAPLEERGADEPAGDVATDREWTATAESADDPPEDDDSASPNRAEEPTPADAPSPGIDPASLESVAESASEEEADPDPTGDRDLADEVNRGVDVEDAIDPGDVESANREPARDAAALVDELDVGPDLESVAEPDAESSPEAPEPDGESEAADDEQARTGASDRTADADGSLEDRASTATLDPGLDVVSTARSHRKPASKPGAETSAGGRREATEDPEPSGPRLVPADRDAASTTADDRTTPIAVAANAQRAALKGSQEAAELGLMVQRNAARATLEGQAVAQRTALKLASITARTYLHALPGTTRSARERRPTDEETIRSLESTATALEDALAHVDDEDFARDLAVYLERVRAVQTEFDEGRTVRSERIVDLLERGADLLERCGRGLDEST